MSNLTSILSTDYQDVSLASINGNWDALNKDKVESSVFSSTLAAKISVSSVAGSVLSLATEAGETVVVVSKGYITGSASAGSVALIYNGVTKDTVAVKQAAVADSLPFTLTYAEAPGAATANIQTSVIATGALTMGDVKIIVTRIK